MRYLLSRYPEAAGLKGSYGRTCLHLACHYNASYDLVKMLVDARFPDVNVANMEDIHRRLPLDDLYFYYYFKDQWEAIETLAKNVLPPSSPSGCGWSTYCTNGGGLSCYEQKQDTTLCDFFWKVYLLVMTMEGQIVAVKSNHADESSSTSTSLSSSMRLMSRPIDCTSVIRASGAMSRINPPRRLKTELKNIIVTLISRLCSAGACCTVESQGRYLLNVAIDHGVKWSFGMEQIYERNQSVLLEIDPKTRMYPFMMAAAFPYGDIESTFIFLKAYPDVLIFC